MCTQRVESLFVKHKSLIESAIRRNRPLLAAIRIEHEDAAQQLAIAMLSAIRKFKPGRSLSLRAYIKTTLQYEIQKIKRHHKPHGITGVPKGARLSFLYLDNMMTSHAIRSAACVSSSLRLEPA